MSEWLEKKVKELCIIGRGRVISQDEINSNPGIYPVFSSQTANNGEMGKIETFDFEGEYVTWTTDGANAGTVFYRSGRFNCTNVCGTLKEKENDSLDLQFFSYLLSTEAKKHVSYIGNPKLMNGVMAEVKLNLPKSKPEQTRIAEILSTADEAIAHTEALIAKYQRIKTGLMQDLLTKGIDENGNIRSKETHKFVVKNGIEVPEEWEVIKLIDCVDKSTIITYGIVQTGLHVVDGIRVLRTVDLQKDKIDSSNLLRTTEEISNSYKRTILKKFDLVCNVRASVGDFNIIDDDDLVGCNTTRGVARISPKKEINPYYLLWFLRSERNTKQMELLIKGTTFIDINIADLREIWIPIPNNKSEQDKIADKLIQITDTLQDYNRQLLKLQSLKTGLMQDLLSGKVRVNMDNKN